MFLENPFPLLIASVLDVVIFFISFSNHKLQMTHSVDR